MDIDIHPIMMAHLRDIAAAWTRSLRLAALVLGFALTACSESPNYSGGNESIDPSQYFDFSTMYACPVEIDFGQSTLVSIYDVDPTLNPEARPIYATFTDAKGHYSGTMQLPSAAVGSTLWARAFGYETEARVGKDGVRFVSTFADPRSRADGHENHIFTDEDLEAECLRLYGLYMGRLPEGRNNKDRLSETENLAIHTLKDDTEIFCSFVNSGGRYLSQLYYFYFPEEVDAKDFVIQRLCDKAVAAGTEPDLSSLSLRTEFMRFFTNDAADPNKKFLLTRDWGVYYTDRKQYKSGSGNSEPEKYVVHDPSSNRLYGNGFIGAPLSISDADAQSAKQANIIQQTKTSNYVWDTWYYGGYGYVNRNFNNHVGAHHHLRFYGRNYDEHLDEPCYDFPAGYRIGFILKVKNTDKPDTYYCFTTNNALNKDGNVQCARNLSVSASDHENDVTNIVYGYEDQLLESINKNSTTEPDYNDFMFLVTASPAVSTVGLERLTNEGEMFLDGTLLYEDLYPDAGDYDMNDVMVEYEMWVKFDSSNRVTSIESRFWPINYGADYNDDFYMELATDDNNGDFRSYIAPEMVIPAARLRSYSAANKAEIEAGGRPTHSVMHRHEFTPEDNLHRDSVTIENFNPFIYVNNTGREVHLTNGRFCGVKGASTAGLTPGQMKYYPLMIHDGSMLDGCYFPYAMNVPRRFSSVSMEGFTPVTESIYIVLEYQMFLEWMRDPRNPAYQNWYNYYSKWVGQMP